MSADPEPDGVIAAGQRQRAIVETDAYGISPANALDAKMDAADRPSEA
jgi:hypothetical protein